MRSISYVVSDNVRASDILFAINSLVQEWVLSLHRCNRELQSKYLWVFEFLFQYRFGMVIKCNNDIIHGCHLTRLHSPSQIHINNMNVAIVSHCLDLDAKASPAMCQYWMHCTVNIREIAVKHTHTHNIFYLLIFLSRVRHGYRFLSPLCLYLYILYCSVLRSPCCWYPGRSAWAQRQHRQCLTRPFSKVGWIGVVLAASNVRPHTGVYQSSATATEHALRCGHGHWRWSWSRKCVVWTSSAVKTDGDGCCRRRLVANLSAACEFNTSPMRFTVRRMRQRGNILLRSVLLRGIMFKHQNSIDLQYNPPPPLGSTR